MKPAHLSKRLGLLKPYLSWPFDTREMPSTNNGDDLQSKQ